MPLGEENEDTSDQKLEEAQGEIMEETREEELLALKEVLSQQEEVQDEPSNPLPNPSPNTSPTHPEAKTLTQNFCQSISEPLPEAPNS